MSPGELTIGALAQAAGVGVETVRYYQRRGLLPRPPRGAGIRRYGRAEAQRIGFIKRAQALGFSLEEIRGLLSLQDGTDRASIRAIAGQRLAQIRAHLRDLRKMERALAAVLADCEHHPQAPCCPIVASLTTPPAGGVR